MTPGEAAAREAIRETIAAYAQLVDAGRFDEWAGLFAEDGTLEVEGTPARVGRAAIRALGDGTRDSLAAATATGRIRHHVSLPSIALTGGGRATARCYFLAVTDHGPDHWGVYRDDLVEVDGRWLFRRRRCRTEGRAAGGFAAGGASGS